MSMNEIAATDFSDFIDALVGTTAARMRCPSCCYIKEKDVRNVERSHVVVVWQCPCGRRNHTKIATKKPLPQRLVEGED